MVRMTYENMKNKTITTPPYRGTNEYPMSNRGTSYSRFSLEDDGSYKIYYGYRYIHKPITKEHYEALKNVQGTTVLSKEEQQMSWLEHDYVKLVRERDHVATVRPDKTIEFVADNLHQGLRMKLSDWSRGVVYRNYRLGGVVYTHHQQGGVVIPLFRGLIVDDETRMPKQNVQLFRRSINRKKAKQIMIPYQEMFKVAETMIASMPVNNLYSIAKDIFYEHAVRVKLFDDRTDFSLTEKEAYDKADELREDGQYFDSAVLYMIGSGILRQWNLKDYDGSHRWYMKHDSSEYASSLIRSLPKLMYRREKPFDETEVKVGSGITGTQWGFRLLCDGKEVQQY